MSPLEQMGLIVAAVTGIATVYHQYFIANKVRVRLKVSPDIDLDHRPWRFGISLYAHAVQRTAAVESCELIYYPRRYLRFLKGQEHWRVKEAFAISIPIAEGQTWQGFVHFKESATFDELVENLQKMTWRGGLYARVHFSNRGPITKRVSRRAIKQTFFPSRQPQ